VPPFPRPPETRLGPLVAGPAGAHLDAAAGRGCRFGPDGVSLTTPAGTELVPWSAVRRLRVGGPPARRWLRAVPAVLVAVAAADLSLASVRGRTVTVRVGGGRWAGPRVDLGRPAQAPYRARDLDALDALLTELGARGRLAALADPAAAADLIDAAATAAGHRSPGLAGRVRAAVRPLLRA
jgi:hypothetical protein